MVPMQASMTSSWLSTTPVVQSSGRSSWGHVIMMLLGVLRPTHPETSM